MQDSPAPAPTTAVSLVEVFRTVEIPQNSGFWRKMFAFAGPGYLVSVGYMDPGNWATDIAGGSAFGYTLLSVILMSNLMAILLQALTVRLGVGAGLDLAQACRTQYPKPVGIFLWFVCEIAICACDLAEIIGTAIALKLLFGIDLVFGVCLTAFDTLLILYLQSKGFRWLEAFIIALIALVAGCFVVDIWLAQPEWNAVMAGFVPDPQIVQNPAMLYIAIGILGATVMPHNLYLHSAIVKTRCYGEDSASKREAIKFLTIDSTFALMFALFINAAILILAASTFHQQGMTEVAEIQEAHELLTPLLGTAMASTLFALALLASGQNSTVTATLAGQIVMEGFLEIRLPPWLRRLMTRLIAMIPALTVAIWVGESGTAKLLILSQVILSLQLPFAVIPLVQFTSNKKLMGEFAIGPLFAATAWAVSLLIVCLNLKLLYDFFLSF
ncbi:MAG: Nramp family divalent metal transporter [Alphaproteobacteria bacterium]|nr:Nramp family divalent metal transporter [Alphaproteobacteria bacterium]QQS56402.1 MAG: Nramp family divalent metal transporter [Alphaproteobacteria bacterium]